MKYIGCHIYAPHEPAGASAPSSDAIDLDVCRDILVHGCRISVNDDAVVVKGGKGTWADKNPDNGPTSNVLIQQCIYGFVHACLTCGSESIHDWNIVLRDSRIDKAMRVLYLKMRPDTPQHYEHIRVERLTGNCNEFMGIFPWTQFYQMEDRPDMPLSQAHDITVRDIRMKCGRFFHVEPSDKYHLHRFHFENIDVENGGDFNPSWIEGTTLRNVRVGGKEY